MKKAYTRLGQDGTMVTYDSFMEARCRSGVGEQSILASCADYKLDRLGRLWFDHVPTAQERDYAMRHMPELMEDWKPQTYTPPTPVVVVEPGGNVQEYPNITQAAVGQGCSFTFMSNLVFGGRVRDGKLIVTKEAYDRAMREKGPKGIDEMMNDPKRHCRRLNEGLPVASVGRDGAR